MNRLGWLLFITLVFGNLSFVKAQDYTPALLYTRSGDTIVCQLKVLKSYTSAGNFYYLEKDNKKEKKIYKDDLELLIVNQTEVYRFLRIHYKYSAGIETKIFQEIIKGPLTLYAKTYVQTQSLTAGGEMRGAGGAYQDFFLKKEGTDAIIKIGKIGFKKKILTYVDRYDELAAKISSKSYRYDDLKTIVNEYNEWYSKRNP